jgi:hypothetical protein
MFVLIKRIGGLCILASCLFISACGSAATQSPTPDPALIYTSAAQTVEAELTMTDVAGPATATITPFPLITDTPGVPTAILGSGAVLPTLPGPQTTDESTTGTPAVLGPTLVQTAAPTQSQAHGAIEAAWVANDPPDNALVVTGAKFDIVWTMKNISKNTWTKKYSVRFFVGTNFVEQKQYYLKATVAPGDNGTFTVDAVAPSKTGTYQTWWKLLNEQGVPVGDMNLTIKVVKPDTTPVPDTETPSPTETTSP